MNVKIIVAVQQKYNMPLDDLYLPLQVGAEGKKSIGFTTDNTGENISLKNPYFCELTGLYWAWKNLDSDYIGLCHYRRYFSLAKFFPKAEEKRMEKVLTKKQAEKLLSKSDIILPKKRNYFIETIYNHYKHTTYIEPLDLCGNLIKEKYPEYYPAFENIKHTTKMHAFNMMIMKKEYLDEYCNWIFPILFEVEKQIDITKYNKFHARLFGRLSERLFDVWLSTKKYKYIECPVLHIQHINWFKKGTSFLKAKFRGVKYEKSF